MDLEASKKRSIYYVFVKKAWYLQCFSQIGSQVVPKGPPLGAKGVLSDAQGPSYGPLWVSTGPQSTPKGAHGGAKRVPSALQRSPQGPI